MNFSKKLILAGLAVSLLAFPACEHHGHHPPPIAGGGGGKGLTGGCGGKPCGQGPGHGEHFGQTTDRVFEVYIYMDSTDPARKKCLVDLNSITLWTQDENGHAIDQRVKWVSDDDKEYTVAFDTNGSPFADKEFHVKSPDYESHSGKIANKGGYYEYSIYRGGSTTSANLCMKPTDPGVHVTP